MSTAPKRLLDELDEGHARRLLERARTDEPPKSLVRRAIEVASQGGAPSPASPSRIARALGKSRIAILAGTLVVGGLLAWFGTHERNLARLEPAGDGVTPPATKGHDRTGGVVANANADAPSANAEAAPTRSVANLPDAPVPAPVAAPIATPASPRRRGASVAPSVAEDIAPRPLVGDPADLLREANRLRAQGRWSEAASVYQRVIDLGPGSVEAYPADVALGNLELQQSRAAEALARYEHALASHPSGALSGEARWGRARALRALGRAAEERAALEEFCARHPDDPLVPAATRRLAELAERGR